ncbi:PH domain-containing protein [Flavobacterium pallidum]|uniref:Uncharacterized protein YyaB-like PH domain-containing protein n=1 Tax=Flavobacterium pallidum TaxID=2172098 RepID=A0A2S1SJL6_9FLAO|nr:PH domain-containing protein [Flavobacterium pallidum]AWI26549.1 hypothetical protein HYN49_11925 [Flavobacterium pallidum]
MTVFRSAKSTATMIIMWVLVIALPIPIIFAAFQEEQGTLIIPMVIVLLIEAFFISMVLDTKYTVDGEILFYRSGPIRGKIDISKIRKIEENNSFVKYSTLKPGLSNRGFVIHFNTFDDIFISPDNKEAFVKLLLQINPGIQVC